MKFFKQSCIIFFVLFCPIANNGVNARIIKSVGLSIPGTLETYFTSLEKSSVTNLVISGNMNTVDFTFIRNSLSKLAVLDLQNATPENAEIPEDAFYIGNGNDILETVYLPTSLTKIADRAFSNCNNLIKVVIPTSLSEIGNEVFEGCSKLDSVCIPSSLTKWGEYVFAECSSLKVITFSEGLPIIESTTFENCTSLESITIPSSVKYIGHSAFLNCTALYSVLLTEGLDSIGICAFTNCTKLETLHIPASVKSIGLLAFSMTPCHLTVDSKNNFLKATDGVIFNFNMTNLLYCNSFKTGSYIVPESVDTISMGAFYTCMRLTDVVLPTRLKTINEYAFAFCTGIQSMVLPDSLSSIGPGAFSSTFFTPTVSPGNPYFLVVDSVLFDRSITKLLSCPRSKTGSYSMPESVEMIASSAFEICTELTSVTLSPKLKAIGNNAFKFCESLSFIFITNPNPFVIDENVFYSNALDFTIYVPKGSLSVFRNTSGWSSFYSNLREWTLPTSLSNIDNKEVKIRLKNGELIIYGTEVGTSISLISINGTAIRKLTTTDSEEIRLPLPGKGLWLVRVGNKTYKVVN